MGGEEEGERTVLWKEEQLINIYYAEIKWNFE